MSNSLSSALDVIIENKQIKPVFQPIVSLKDGQVVGYEALSRITEPSIIKDAEELFKVASEGNKAWALEALCRKKAIQHASTFMNASSSPKLFLNVNPIIIHDDAFDKNYTRKLVKQYGLNPDNIVYEITEKNMIMDMHQFQRLLTYYKNQNYKIAIDDVGAGYSGLNLISEVQPDYLKLDLQLTKNIDTNPLKFALVKAMADLTKVSNMSLIAEGIETEGELAALISIGVQYGQGYFIQKPDDIIHPIATQMISLIKDFNIKSNPHTSEIYCILQTPNRSIDMGIASMEDNLKDSYISFIQEPEKQAVCVVDGEQAVGILSRENVVNLYNEKNKLGQLKHYQEYLDTEFLSVDSHTPLPVLSRLAMSRTRDKLYESIVITQDNAFLGIITVKELVILLTQSIH